MTAYASVADFRDLANLPVTVLDKVPTERQQTLLEAASRTLDSYMAANHWAPPFQNPSRELVRRTCHVAAYDLLSGIGFNPEQGQHTLVMKNYDDALAWARDVGRGNAMPVDRLDATPDVDEGAPVCESDEPRGWV